jgi:hypothetical protein
MVLGHREHIFLQSSSYYKLTGVKIVASGSRAAFYVCVLVGLAMIFQLIFVLSDIRITAENDILMFAWRG